MGFGVTCYVTGRDHELVYIGLGCSNKGSPGVAKNIILDNLKFEHVKNLFPKQFSDEEIKDFVVKSGGVPRFIKLFLDLVELKENKNESYEDLYKKFIANDIIKPMMDRLMIGMHVDNYWNKYLQWMAFSQFQISIDPFVLVDKNDWITNKNHNKTPQPTPLLTVLEHFNLFLRKEPKPRSKHRSKHRSKQTRKSIYCFSRACYRLCY